MLWFTLAPSISLHAAKKAWCFTVLKQSANLLTVLNCRDAPQALPTSEVSLRSHVTCCRFMAASNWCMCVMFMCGLNAHICWREAFASRMRVGALFWWSLVYMWIFDVGLYWLYTLGRFEGMKSTSRFKIELDDAGKIGHYDMYHKQKVINGKIYCFVILIVTTLMDGYWELGMGDLLPFARYR